MALRKIEAILWRSYLAATSDALWGVGSSQYYIEIGIGNYEDFFAGRAEESSDELGNPTFRIWLESFDGSNGVDRQPLTFKKKRPDKERGDKWTIEDQREDGAYALWRRGRGPLTRYQDMPPDEQAMTFLVIVRDVAKLFHGRWIRPDDFEALPDAIRDMLSTKGKGWSLL